MLRRLPSFPAALLGAGLALTAVMAAPPARRDGRAAPVPLVTGKSITPLGVQTGVGSFPCNLVLTPDGRYLIVTGSGYRQFVSALSSVDGRLVSQLEFNAQRTDGSGRKEGLYYGLAMGPQRDGLTPVYVSRGAEDRVSVLSIDGSGSLQNSGRTLSSPSGRPGFTAPSHVAGVALSRDGARLYAVNNNTLVQAGGRGSLSIIDISSNRVLGKVETGGFPYAIAVRPSGDGEKVYITSERDGSVTVIDPIAKRRLKEIPTGDHPIALVLDPKQDRLYVANSGSDTVSVIDPRTDDVVATIPLRPDDVRGLPGATPTGLALSPDGRRLFVSLADMSAVAVVDLKERRVKAYIPVGWYPTAVVVSAHGKRLFVANAKGVNARNPNGAPAGPEGKWGQYIQNLIEGTVSTLDMPRDRELKRLTERVIENNRIVPNLDRMPESFRNPGIEHVFYILKENRTYDQVLGDLPQGDGDPKLCMFPRSVTPNQHALAERFVLLDNFYCCAEVSADGWNWSTSGMANEYVTRNAPYSYSGRGRSFDYEGQNNGVPVDLVGIPDVARAPGGYIWDLVAARGLPFRNYGFFTNVVAEDAVIPNSSIVPGINRPTKKALVGTTDPNYLRFNMTYADSDAWVIHNTPAPEQMKTFGRFNAPSRFSAWKREFDEYVRNRNLPRFVMIRLPRDHTQGTAPGQHSPRAMVADNDYGVGQIVEAISRSPYWMKSAIFIIEDDAQNGFDHVDAHRSICFVVSPFVRRAAVDHRFYNTDSVLRTMELMLGLPAMNQYDAIAPHLDVFGPKPLNDSPFAPILPAREIIGEVNKRTAYRAKDSIRLDFSREDAVPDQVLNDILWHAVMGKSAPKPPIRYGLKARPNTVDAE